MVSGDAIDRLIDAIGTVSDEVRFLSKKVDDCSTDTRITNDSVRAIRQEYAGLAKRVDDVQELAETAERHGRRHDSGFRQASETDAKRASELAAVVIALDDTRKLAKKCVEEIDEIKKAQVLNAEETKAQTPVLAKVDDQTKQMSAPTKAAALLNFAIGLVYLLCKIIEWLGHR